MNPAVLSGWLMAGTALLVMAFCLPLIYRKVSRNELYGFRTREAFESEEKWLEVNEAGGKVMFWCSLPMLVCGVYQIVAAPSSWQLSFLLIPVLAPSVGALVFCYLRSRKSTRHFRK